MGIIRGCDMYDGACCGVSPIHPIHLIIEHVTVAAAKSGLRRNLGSTRMPSSFLPQNVWTFLILPVFLLSNHRAYRMSSASPMTFHLSFLDTAEAWGVLFVFDTIIFALTVCNAYSTRRRVGAQTQTDMPIYTLIIRDGTSSYILSPSTE
jgi:hypothetical protein